MAMSGEKNAPTIRPVLSFNAKLDCEALRRAMKGIGTDEDALINILCRRPWQQRHEIALTYKAMFNNELENDLASETSGHFCKLLQLLVKTPAEIGAFSLHEAIDGPGTDEDCLVEVIATKSNEELQVVKMKYFEMYAKSLDEDVSNDTSGVFRRFLRLMLNCNRPPESQKVDMANAAAEAKSIYEAGQKRLGTDEDRFTAILCGHSYNQLRAIFICYANDYKKDIYDVIKSEFSGDVEKGLLALVSIIRNQHGYFADRLHDAIARAGTHDDLLLRIIVSRCDIDLEHIKAEYGRVFGKTLWTAIHEETSGDYKKALLALVGD